MSDSNVGLGMVPCRKGCRCDDCTIEHLTAQVKYIQECNGRQYKRITKLEDALLEIANSGVGVHSVWGWLAPFAHKALKETDDE